MLDDAEDAKEDRINYNLMCREGMLRETVARTSEEGSQRDRPGERSVQATKGYDG